MKFEFTIAKRYLFSKKSHNAINIISIISACGIVVGTMALVCVLSVLNGFQHLIGDLFVSFDPELKITLVEGKTFDINTPEIQQIKNLPEIAVFSEVIEDNALLKYGNRQIPATLKGVTNNFALTSGIDSIMLDGEFRINDKYRDYAVMGKGLAYDLGAGVYFVEPLIIYAPKSKARINMARPDNAFNQKALHLSGIFAVNQQEYDSRYVIISLNLARSLFQYENKVTAIELKLHDGVKHGPAEKKIQQLLGDTFVVKNKYEQKEDFYNMMRIEKLISYLILSFILLIAVFNIIGSLTMLIIDKTPDILTLKSLGANNTSIKRIFLFEGWLISILGAAAGMLLGVILVLLQQEFGLIRMQGSFIIQYYPVRLIFSDLMIVFGTVVILGFLAAYYPVKYIERNLLNKD